MNAKDSMAQLNKNALHSREGSSDIFIEDVQDPDGRWYRIEYQCDLDGRNARAKVRHNPWGRNTVGLRGSCCPRADALCYTHAVPTGLVHVFLLPNSRYVHHASSSKA